MARTAERGLFDFFFLAEGLRLREHRGRSTTSTWSAGRTRSPCWRPWPRVTDRIGLTGTINTTFNEPFEVARQFATLDQLSDGRAGWNIVTSSDAFTGANFRRGGFLDHADRYQRAEEFLTVAREFWDSWASDAVLADVDAGIYLDPDRVAVVDHHGPQFDVRGVRDAARWAAGSSGAAAGRRLRRRPRFGARYADALFTLHGSLEDGQRYYADVKGRAESYGRDPDQLKVFPAATFVLGDTDAEAQDKSAATSATNRSAARRRSRCSSRCGAATFRTTTPTGRCPISIRSSTAHHPGPGPARRPVAVARRYRERAEAENLSIRELVIAVTSREQFVGTAATSPTRSTATSRPTLATGSFWCRT